jgi:hypothetical protein
LNYTVESRKASHKDWNHRCRHQRNRVEGAPGFSLPAALQEARQNAE